MKKSTANSLLFLGGIFTIAYCANESEQKKQLKNENRFLKGVVNRQDQYIRQQSQIILSYIQKDHTREGVLCELERLKFDIMDSSIKLELGVAIDLVKKNNELKALAILAKVLESLLKKLFQNSQNFLSQHPQKRFVDYINFANSQSFFSNEAFHFATILRVARNEEVHELNAQSKRDSLTLKGYLLASIGLIRYVAGAFSVFNN